MRDDSARLAELRRLVILDSSPEQAYDDITHQLTLDLGVPIAMVSLLDERRDWFKARVGMGMTESPAATSFCEAFFDSPDDVIVAEDTTADARFAAHPLVVGAPFVRFYAAARVRVGGHTIGTLCAYDVAPKKLQPEQLTDLRTLAGVVARALESRVPPTA